MKVVDPFFALWMEYNEAAVSSKVRPSPRILPSSELCVGVRVYKISFRCVKVQPERSRLSNRNKFRSIGEIYLRVLYLCAWFVACWTFHTSLTGLCVEDYHLRAGMSNVLSPRNVKVDVLERRLSPLRNVFVYSVVFLNDQEQNSNAVLVFVYVIHNTEEFEN